MYPPGLSSGQTYALSPIGVVRSCYTGKFGIPRQAGLVTAAEARLELFAEFAREEAFAGLEGFSHLWLIFIFHDALAEGWRPTVRPPKLGGRRKVGVFASRSPHRPNPIGLSAVAFLGFARDEGGLALRLGGADLLDGTPVLDVKPYIPYADALPQARSGFVPAPPDLARGVTFSPRAQAQMRAWDPDGHRHLPELITQILRQDPRPGYLDRYPDRRDFAMRLYDLEVKWRETDGQILVTALEPAAD
ncbi:MAG: tRNA (N6-threonylcarbamoyladenosine(37)-N6)-methyltransferase TrmO [Chromatiaceae bacterium]